MKVDQDHPQDDHGQRRSYILKRFKLLYPQSKCDYQKDDCQHRIRRLKNWKPHIFSPLFVFFAASDLSASNCTHLVPEYCLRQLFLHKHGLECHTESRLVQQRKEILFLDKSAFHRVLFIIQKAVAVGLRHIFLCRHQA